MGFRVNWDALGIATSLACAIHCLFLPLLLTSLPVIGLEWLVSEGFEIFMILLAFAIGVNALYHGYRKHHHTWLPMLLFSVGFLFLTARLWWHEAELFLLIPAVIGIVSAHYLNYRRCKKSKKCHTSDCDH